ncbi:HDOD domain-containing protein [Fundidesulfovibrio butyratiphilus]
MDADHSTVSLDETASEALFVARQPVFDTRMNVWGYELLYRQAETSSTAEFADGAAATSKVIADGVSLGRSGLSDMEKTLINFPSRLLIEGYGFALPPECCVIEILETVEPSPEILDSLARLKEAGYILALDDFVGDEGHTPFLELADIIKVDMLLTPPEKLPELAARLASPKRMLLAEKVEDDAMHRKAKDLGFSLFQGFFYRKPEIVVGRKMSASQASKLRLLQELASDDYDLIKVSNIIETDLSLSYRLLRYINSAYFGRSQSMESIRQAAMFLGQRNLAMWLQAVIMSDINPTDKGRELVFLSVRRAKFLEMLARSLSNPPAKPDALFVLGLFSFLDSLLGQPMAEVLKDLPLSPELIQALLGRHGQFSGILDLAESFEKANWRSAQQTLKGLHLPPAKASILNADAMRFAGALVQSAKSPIKTAEAKPARKK